MSSSVTTEFGYGLFGEWLDLDDLEDERHERTPNLGGLRTLSERSRGSLMAKWGENLARRFGAKAPDEVRGALGLDTDSLPNDPGGDTWMPAWIPLAATEVIVERFMDSDPAMLERCIEDDIRRGTGKVAGFAIRKLGPGTLLRKAPMIHPHAYDCGALHTEVASGEGTLRFEGSALFGQPTFQLTQLIAQRIMLRMCGRVAEEVVARRGADALEIRLRWS